MNDHGETIELESKSLDGNVLRATFLPSKGMNCISFQKGSCELIDPLTEPLFEERFAGLGCIIGPHFHHRKKRLIPKVKNEEKFPHIARIKQKGIDEPFSHGIGRYAPWKMLETGKTHLLATLSGKDEWRGSLLKELEGQDFTLTFRAELTTKGLVLHLTTVSETDSLVGIHYYFRLSEKKGTIRAEVQEKMLLKGEKKEIPEKLKKKAHLLEFSIDEELDCTFHPFPNPISGKIELLTGEYQLQVQYQSPSEESCFQLYHPKGASFICIEPISSYDPSHPNLTVSSIQIELIPTLGTENG